MLEAGRYGLRSFTFSTHQLSSLNNPFWIFSLGSWKQGWGRKPAVSKGRAWTPTKTWGHLCLLLPSPTPSFDITSSKFRWGSTRSLLQPWHSPSRCQAQREDRRAPHLQPSHRSPASAARSSHGADNVGRVPRETERWGRTSRGTVLPARARMT